jgi:pyruvate dehydrogenase E2 component (dihydrolipoamide acetyltransferase)
MSAGAPIVMPKLGLTMTEGLVASWRVAPGDRIKSGDVLFVVETEKVATDIEAEADGQIERILVGEGESVPVGAVVATWTGPAGDIMAPPELSSAPAPREQTASAPVAPVNEAQRFVVTPHARKRARQVGVALSDVAGSGPGGRIKAADVEAAIGRAQHAIERPAPFEPEASKSRETRRPASAIEKVIARRLVASKQTIPHFYVFAHADVTRLLALRDEMNADADRPRLSVTHFVLAAVVRALGERPEINVVWRDDEIVGLGSIDIGLAVDTERGLLAPVLRDLAGLGLDAIAAAATALVRKARSGRLDAGELEGGALSVSNVGMYGASHLAPIINPRQSAVIGVAATQPVFRPDEVGAPALRQELGLVFSGDHRVLDGVRAARFLDSLTKLLESPLLLLR